MSENIKYKTLKIQKAPCAKWSGIWTLILFVITVGFIMSIHFFAIIHPFINLILTLLVLTNITLFVSFFASWLHSYISKKETMKVTIYANEQSCELPPD